MEKYIKIIITFMVTGFLFSCEPADHHYKDLIKGKDVIYPGKIGSLVYHGGNERFGLDLVFAMDPNVDKMIIYWNNNKESKEYILTAEDIGQRREIIIDDIPEGFYEFEIFTFNTHKVRSIPTKISGRVYGETYIASLSNRAYLESDFDRGRAWIEWVPETNDKFIHTKITYTGMDDNEIIIIMPKTEEWTYLDNYKPNTKVYYQAVYKPDDLSLDIFYSEKNSVVIGD